MLRAAIVLLNRMRPFVVHGQRRRHRCRMVLVLITVCAAVGCAGKGITAGPGLAIAKSSAGGGSNTSVGLVAGLRFGVGSGSGLITSLDLQPFRVQNPARDEAHRILFLIPMLRLGNERFFVAGGLGSANFHFTGADCICGHDGGLALGLSLGTDGVRLGETPLSVEVFWRGGVTSDFELEGSLMGLQLGWQINRDS